MSVMDTQLTIRISSSTRQKLEELANSEKRKLSEYIRLILENHINEKTNPGESYMTAEEFHNLFRNNESRDQNNPPSPDKKPAEVKYCKTCGAPLPDPSLDYCVDPFSCGNHLHLQGRPHNSKLCAFCQFPKEVEFAVASRKAGQTWDWIKGNLETDHTRAEVSGIIQAAKLKLGEEE